MNIIQSFLHDALIATGHVQQCALIKTQDWTVRGTSLGYHLAPDQIEHFVEAFRMPARARESGLPYEDRSYKCVRADQDAIYAKSGKQGLILVRTDHYIVVSTYNESMNPAICVEATEKLADYFRQKKQ